MGKYHDIKVVAFDADDTLWDCQSHFDEVERQYCQMLSPWADEATVSSRLFETECKNMPVTGYGSKAFTLSLLENAIEISNGQIPARDLLAIQELGIGLLNLPATPLPGVKETLKAIKTEGRCRMVVFTKGEIMDQENKLLRSGLWDYFDRVVVVASKTTRQYRELCETFGITINELLMVGNSFKSDIEPVLQLGGRAVHVPFHVVWAHEVTEEYDHENLTVIKEFRELTKVLSIMDN